MEVVQGKRNKKTTSLAVSYTSTSINPIEDRREWSIKWYKTKSPESFHSTNNISYFQYKPYNILCGCEMLKAFAFTSINVLLFYYCYYLLYFRVCVFSFPPFHFYVLYITAHPKMNVYMCVFVVHGMDLMRILTLAIECQIMWLWMCELCNIRFYFMKQ